MIKKHQESSYCDEAMKHVSPASTIFFKMTPDLLLSSVPMRTQPLSYKWACPNFNNKQNFGSWSLKVG